MKDNRFVIMVSSILCMIFFLFFIFGVATVFNDSLNSETKDSLNLSISLFGLLTSFGGSLLGALIAGLFTLKSIEKDQHNKKIERILDLQVNLLFNADSLLKMFKKVFEYKGFDAQKAKDKLKEYDNKSITNNTFVKAFNDLEKSGQGQGNKIEFSEEFEDIKNYIMLLESQSSYYSSLMIQKKGVQDKTYYINLLFKLKQLLKKLDEYIEVENENVYLIINTFSKEIIMHCFYIHYTLNDEVSNKNITDLLKQLED
ncbi:hypothetical protein [Staphylococcus saprophyticus]|uniref:hypothetical protein n=1 Tax=Staphylococcus saprophyticus TaxID=29385 RepID=UPI000E69051E|nr:hypothetical protein [Staphylococcus saprophyticus]RIO31801.1 hypothetical protein BUZ74_10145 [Staphylococcus saprophyticus]